MRQWIVFSCLLFFFSQPMAAKETLVPDAADSNAWILYLRQCSAKIFSLKGKFSQEIQCDTLLPEARFAGTFEVKRKGKYRWMYSEPEARLMVSDGTTSFVYNKAASCVYEGHPADAILSGVVKILVGEADEDFFIEVLGGADGPDAGLVVIQFTPKEPHPFIRSVLLTISTETPCIKRVIVVDTAGCIIRTTFQNIQINTGIKDIRFRFSSPKNAVIINP